MNIEDLVNCTTCNKEFELSYTQKYNKTRDGQATFFCSRACSNRRQSEREYNSPTHEICETCGKEFELTAAQRAVHHKRSRFFCSPEHLQHGKRPNPQPLVNCAGCGNPMILSPQAKYRYSLGQRQFYCSKQCRSPVLVHNCDYCTKEFTLDAYRRKRLREFPESKLYCSEECRHSATSDDKGKVVVTILHEPEMAYLKNLAAERNVRVGAILHDIFAQEMQLSNA